MSSDMKCPACDHSMKTRESSGIEVEVCGSCLGLWLDEGEFDSLVAQRFAGMDFEDLLAMSRTEPMEPRACPIDGTKMDAVFFQELELDRCPTCEGVFLDGDDRAELRARAEHERDVQRIRAQREAESSAEARPHLSELDEIELENVQAQPSTQTDVSCAGCGAVVRQASCIKRIDAYWCEECVIRGDYPGGYGETVAKRVNRAAQSMAKASARQKAAKQARDLRAKNRDRVTIDRRGRARRGAWTYEEYSLAFERAGNSIRDFFGKFRREDDTDRAERQPKK